MRSTVCKIVCAVLIPFAALADWRQDFDDACSAVVASIGAKPVVDPVPDYVSRWLFDDNAATTNVLDDAGRNNGYATANSAVMHGAGKIGTGSFTNCAVDKVWIPDSAGINSNTFSLCAWVWQYANDAGYPSIVLKPITYVGGNEEYGLGGNAGKLSFEAKVAGAMKYALGSANSMNETTGGWHFMAGVYDGTNCYVYLDGIERGKTAASGAITTTTEPLQIGRALTVFSGFNGKIDDVRYYGRALSSNEQMTIYNAYK